MAQTTRLASFGPVIVVATPAALLLLVSSPATHLLLVSTTAALPSPISRPDAFVVVKWCVGMVVTWQPVDVAVATRLEFCCCGVGFVVGLPWVVVVMWRRLRSRGALSLLLGGGVVLGSRRCCDCCRNNKSRAVSVESISPREFSQQSADRFSRDY
jgi:hypothetical protein